MNESIQHKISETDADKKRGSKCVKSHKINWKLSYRKIFSVCHNYKIAIQNELSGISFPFYQHTQSTVKWQT